MTSPIPQPRIPKPEPGEYAPYAVMYIDLVPDDGRVLDHLREGFTTLKELVLSLPEEKLAHPYAPGKWTIKDILVHLIDDERVYAYRALRFARGDDKELPGFEQDDYAASARANERDLASILEEYEAVRRSTVALYESFDESVYTHAGTADGTRMSVRALIYHIAGHERHHLKVIRERYV